jgi:hypothetical protein
MATNWPAYARLWTVATAGQSAASYTTSGDTTSCNDRTAASMSSISTGHR